jgi:PAS domain S-box-containing protein
MSEDGRDPERLHLENVALRGRIAALEQSERRFHDTVKHLDEGYYSCAVDGVLHEHNVAFNRILGFDGDQNLQGSQLPDFWRNPEDRKAYLDELMSKGIIRNFLIDAKRINGDELVVMVNSHLVKDETGKPVRIEGTFTDFTERRRMEEALQESEEKYHSLFDNAEVGMYRSRLDGSGITALNQRLADIFGHTKEEMLRNPATMRWADPAARDEMVGLLREHGELRDHEIDIVTKGGEIRTALASVRIYPREGYLEGTAIDITRRKRADAELRIKNQVFEDSIASQSVADKNGVITLVNPAFLRLWGYAETEQANGKSVGSFFADLADATLVLDALAAHDAWEGRFLARRTDGSTFVCHGYATSLRNAAGELTGYQSTNLDVTPLAEAERQLQALNENLARSNQELEQFAYVASHDLQEPLRMVSSFTQLLAQRYEDKLDQDAREFIGFAVDGANRMQRLIQDLLLYSRIATRGLPPAPLDAHDALGEAVSNLQVAIQETRALVTNGDLPAVLGDRTQIAQVFQNLIGNAIKFHKPGEPPRVHVSAERNPKQPGLWTFEVTDNGIGIDPRHFERLFVIFQRLHGKQEYPGTGIGLALCKRIVERHGGRIWLKSETGKGTSFFFTLPAAQSGKGAHQ